MVAECEFSKNERTIADYYDMKEDLSIKLFKSYPNKELFLFGASGFSDDFNNIKDDNLKLIDLKKCLNKQIFVTNEWYCIIRTGWMKIEFDI